MNKKNYLLLFCLSFVTTLMASPSDSISTVYRDGEYVTSCQVWVNASDSISDTVTHDFDFQMRYKLDALFGWALKGMNLRKEKNELMEFYFKSTSYNKKTNVIRGVGDVVVPGLITVPNIIVESRLTSKEYTNGKKTVYIDLLSSNGFLKKMYCSFSVIPKNDKEVIYTLESHVRFGWFFNIFLTKKRFNNIMEWRLKRFVHNLRDEAERREKKSVDSKQLSVK